MKDLLAKENIKIDVLEKSNGFLKLKLSFQEPIVREKTYRLNKWLAFAGSIPAKIGIISTVLSAVILGLLELIGVQAPVWISLLNGLFAGFASAFLLRPLQAVHKELEEMLALKTAANKHLEEKVRVKKQEAKFARLKLKEQLGKLNSDERVKMDMLEQALDNRQREKELVKQENHDRFLQRQLSSTKLIEIPLSELKLEDGVGSTSPPKHRGLLHLFNRSSKEKSPTIERKHKHTQGESHSPPTERAYKRSQSEMVIKRRH